MESNSTADTPGFAASPGFSWDEYIKYRPRYPQSMYKRIYDYHTEHSGNWDLAHDVGAGAGIATQEIATRFEKVIVSDPNAEYLKIATGRLTQDFKLPREKFTFMAEGAEKSSLGKGSIDLILVCEAIHWTDIPLAVKEFARELKSGGTLSINHYGRPQLLGNEPAQGVWDTIFDVWVDKLLREHGAIVARAWENGDTGLDTVPFPVEEWEAGAKRIMVNSGGEMDPYRMSLKYAKPGPYRVGDSDEREIVAVDQDWISEQDVEWLKGCFMNFLPSNKSIPEEDLRGLWQELEDAFGPGQKAKVSWPVVQLLATRK